MATPTSKTLPSRTPLQEGEIVTFLRKRDYQAVRELGQGATGKTVLLYDPEVQVHLVCKKYSPLDPTQRGPLFRSFVREIKLLHRIHHPNVVRFFNYYLYQDTFAGYILMEFIEGVDIDDHLSGKPEHANDVFLQAIDGFAHLEQVGVMHRDIRPSNLLVNQDGVLKIIDLGFGKRVVTSDDFDNSITLNWYVPTPDEFREQRYDFSTEVYFLGKLFERLLQQARVEHFKYSDALRQMCEPNPANRWQSFSELQQSLRSRKFTEISFAKEQREIYQAFAGEVAYHVTKIERNAKYATDVGRVAAQLAEAHRNCMLEESLPDAKAVLRCIINGSYWYRQNGFSTTVLRDFVLLLREATNEQSNIIMANLHTKLDAIDRYDGLMAGDDDVPF